ncbi:glutamate--tRNA ligase [Candidatus Falkowbacteria bacterium CG10_big_fil_rev_8_21_14_0_10_37_14]|uniref:Glutamate--tRNA ligase n=1 Tax=Candidatus Falkowbacteria bacterium CG10_big_fil_rev_8_21_14_0_10_37_14 TaxID=1974561 RepID=A0A2M6WSJ8_9BACT|nr:MAG: glutamate--tRNA ligase [Candidatus Falkowbacteria bacterium CG10_big_fil_rev_8_21_14_0_10_37_14]
MKNMKEVRLRLAPSPTGFLHIGNLRTALFGYLLAKSMRGQFILRIEDTDQKREVVGAVDSLIEIMNWIGLKFDEGPHIGGSYSPYIQSKRLDIYKKYTNELLNKDGAYPCFCSADDLTKMRKEQTDRHEAPRYNRKCRHLSQAEVEEKKANGLPFVIRQKLPLDGEIVVHDELRGDIKFKLTDLEDHVLIKSDGVPTYHFANIVDDHLMKISHVTRGDEWLPSFPKNILLYQSFGWEVPKFIHLPLILNKTGGKLSKRQGDVFVEQYKDKGYLPEALINFCVLLGWHPKHDKEILSLTEMEQEFALDGMGVSSAVFDIDKLDYYNGVYIRAKSDEELLALLKPLWNTCAEKSLTEQQNDEYLLKIIPTIKERLKTLNDINSLTGFYFGEKIEFDNELILWKALTAEQTKNNLEEISIELEKISEKDWHKEYLEKTMVGWLKTSEKKVGDYLWPLRVALTGLKASPGPFEVAGVLGRELTLKRLNQAVLKIKTLKSNL